MAHQTVLRAIDAQNQFISHGAKQMGQSGTRTYLKAIIWRLILNFCKPYRLLGLC